MYRSESGRSFLLYAPGAEGVFCSLEDAAETGWFLLDSTKHARSEVPRNLYNLANVIVLMKTRVHWLGG